MGKLLLALMASSSCAMIALAPLPALAAKNDSGGVRSSCTGTGVHGSGRAVKRRKAFIRDCKNGNRVDPRSE
jgi:hypothetical protein